MLTGHNTFIIPSGVQTVIFQENKVDTMAADAPDKTYGSKIPQGNIWLFCRSIFLIL